jgi:hypothetical protein
MKHRGRWPMRDYAASPGRLVAVSWRATPQQKKWLDDGADATGRSLAHHIDLLLERARNADADQLSSNDMYFGPSNSGLMLLLGLILAETQRRERQQWGEDLELDAVIAASITRMFGVIFGIAAMAPVPRPATITEEQWETWIAWCLRPLYDIRDYLIHDRRNAARVVDEKIIDRLGEVLRDRIARMPPHPLLPHPEDPLGHLYGRRRQPAEFGSTGSTAPSDPPPSPPKRSA